jgi:hypothetical protein
VISSTNQQVLLSGAIEQLRVQRAPQKKLDEYFEVFVAEQLLKDFDLSDEQIASGLVDGGDDGGIDGFYTFVNDELVMEDTEFSEFGKKDIRIEVVVIQAKLSASFSDTAVDKMHHTLADLLDLSRPLDQIASLYNSDLLAAGKLFRATVQELAATFPARTFSIFYASQGTDIHPKVSQKAKKLEGMVRQLWSGSSTTCQVRIVTAGDLYELAQKGPTSIGELTLTEKLESRSGGVVGLVKLTDYVTFIADDKGRLRRSFFEANVRDYQGRVEVNREIQQCLESNWKEEFWWLNNGITIVAGKLSPKGKTLVLEDPQIVNGLQTSREIHRYFEAEKPAAEEREVLVRIISPKDAESRDRIIKATNSQTAISPASLRATDEIQRQIEQYLKSFDLYYDRRKNFYKNEGKPSSRIISIPLMAQALMAIMLQQPDMARARPSSLLKKSEDYERVFNVNYPIEIFRVVIELTRTAEEVLIEDATLSKEDRVNLKFYLALHLAAAACKMARPTPRRLKGIVGKSLDQGLIKNSVAVVKSLYKKLGANSNVAKGAQFREALLQELDAAFPKKGKSGAATAE